MTLGSYRGPSAGRLAFIEGVQRQDNRYSLLVMSQRWVESLFAQRETGLLNPENFWKNPKDQSKNSCGPWPVPSTQRLGFTSGILKTARVFSKWENWG